MEFLIVIPARMQSTRLPGKPLIDLCGKSLIERTYLRCLEAVENDNIIIATDDELIWNHCKIRNLNVIMTSRDCLTGTDRVAEVSKKIKADHYINVQGDEPLMDPQDILDILNAVKNHPEDIINGYTKIDNKEQFESLSIPKVVFRPDGRLLYMSRSAIPGNKKGIFRKGWRQVCIYAFPANSLIDFFEKENKTTLEYEEDIEILRFLEFGYEVRMVELSNTSVAVDTPDDVIKVKNILCMNNKIKTILWDFDGVLMDSNKVRDQGFWEVLSAFPEEQVDKLMSFHKQNGGLSRYVKFNYFFKTIRNEKVDDKTITEYANNFSVIMKKLLVDQTLLIEETINFVRSNFTNYDMHIVSGSDGNELRYLCSQLNIDRYFISINGSPTPKDLLIEKVMKHHNYRTENTLMIGDSINDYEAAMENSILFWAYGNHNLNKFNNIEFNLL